MGAILEHPENYTQIASDAPFGAVISLAYP